MQGELAVDDSVEFAPRGTDGGWQGARGAGVPGHARLAPCALSRGSPAILPVPRRTVSMADPPKLGGVYIRIYTNRREVHLPSVRTYFQFLQARPCWDLHTDETPAHVGLGTTAIKIRPTRWFEQNEPRNRHFWRTGGLNEFNRPVFSGEMDPECL